MALKNLVSYPDWSALFEPFGTHNDPLLPAYWHLRDASGFSKGANVLDVWDEFRGVGIIVGIIDDGVEYTHPELAPNYDTALDFDARDNDFDAYPGASTDKHGTAVAGAIGAALDNSAGGAGVAPQATLVGYRINFGADAEGPIEAAFERLTSLDVANNSWGYDGFLGDDFVSPDFAPIAAHLENALNTGRGGLGTIVVFSAGNSRSGGQDVNYHNFQNYRGVITVAATSSGGNITSFSTPGDAILVAAPGSSIKTTDRVGAPGYSSGDFTTRSGTSFSAPIVSGVAALMLDANPSLGWRDVQEILASTAIQTGSAASWSFNHAGNWNGGAMHVSRDFGFGLVNGMAAVRVAESWRQVSTSANETVASALVLPNLAIPDLGAALSVLSLAAGVRIDHVEVDLAIAHTNISHLRVVLTSPTGTQSVLFNNAPTSQHNISFTFSTTHDWGELSGGAWTLSVSDTVAGTTGTLQGWAIRAFGDPVGNDTYVYTDEFSSLAPADFTRLMLSDAGGSDGINTAALTSATSLDLRPGQTSIIDGQSVTISAGTVIEDADTGDGNDTIVGNDIANWLRGWRGNDTLDGGFGADTMEGGVGDDTANGGSGNDAYLLNSGFGHDVIIDNDATAGNVDTVSFGPGITSGAVTVTRVGDDLKLTVGAGADAIAVQGWFAGDDQKVERVQFTDGTVWDVATLSAMSGRGGQTITGTPGNDVLTGWPGNDTIDGLAGADTMGGAAGDDTYFVDNAGDIVTEGANAGTDTVKTSITYTLGTNVENLTLIGAGAIIGTGNALDNVLTGNSASNTLDGRGGVDTMIGGGGSDTYVVDNAGDTITENAGEGTADRVNSSITYSLVPDVNVENLTLTGTGAIDGTGNALGNTITGNGGANVLTGGAGNDRYIIGAGDSIVETAAEGTDSVESTVTVAALWNNVENLTLTGSGATNGTGNALANTITGNSLANQLNGLMGADTMIGGGGNDTYTVDEIGDVVTENAASGTDTINSSIIYALPVNVEKLTLTGTAHIDATGNSANNTLRGNTGNNLLDGGAGSDTLIGGTGDDTYTVDNAADAVTESANEGFDTINASVTRTIASHVEKLALTGTSAINGTGTTADDYIVGNSANNTLKGNAGNDLLNGGTGSGVDTLNGDAGNDALEGMDGNDTLSDVGGNNLFNGGAGNDAMTGNAGNELFIGGAGNDTITTGSGADIIAFNRGDGQDTVNASGGADNTLSIGGGIRYADMSFTKNGNSLELNLGGASEKVTLVNWYLSAPSNKSVINLQVIAGAMADFDASSADPLLNQKVQTFDFTGLVSAFDAASAPNNWALMNALLDERLGGSDSEALGGDLGYRYGLGGSLAGIGFDPAVAILSNASFGVTSQALQSLADLQQGIKRLS